MTDDRDDRLFVASVEKAFLVLRAFRAAQNKLKISNLGLNQITEFSGLNKSAAQRFTDTLVTLGYLERDPRTRRYRPAIRLLELSYTYLVSDRLAQLAMPVLIDLSRTHKVTSNLCVPMDTDIIFTVRIPQEKASFGSTLVGRKMPAFCTASGNAILSRMPADAVSDILARSVFTPFTEHTVTDPAVIADRIRETRALGYSILAKETQMNVISVAAPILNAQGTAIAAVQVPISLPARTLDHVRTQIAPYVVAAADSISREISEMH
ncbi:MAG: IclR family transcriptional regulator [Paracoccaceae bacterium]|nr:IclR family transcriptional regulator [Paracoccaceae bacterium]